MGMSNWGYNVSLDILVAKPSAIQYPGQITYFEN